MSTEHRIVKVKPVVTQKGLEAMAGADGLSFQVKFTHMVFGRGLNGDGYNPTESQQALKDPDFVKIGILDGEKNGNRILLNTVWDDDRQMDIREVGLIAEPGILFSVYSMPGLVVTKKIASDQLYFPFDQVINSADVNKFTWVASKGRANLSVAVQLSEITTQLLDVQNKYSQLLAELEDHRIRLSALENK